MFSLAFVRDGQPLLGVLYDPYQDRLYTAILGQGAFINGRPLQVNSHPTLQGSRLGLAAWKLSTINSSGLITDAISHGARSLTLVCITYEAALIATAQVEGNIYPYPNPWDIAALKVIVEEAGGKVTDLTGQEQRYDQPLNGAIISNGHIHQALVELTQPHLISDSNHKQV
jgi:fructose-1,6-bisphosphatase/inositol monophosphatase family enzyme